MVVYLSTFLGIIAILCKQSPFKLLPPPAPADGVGPESRCSRTRGWSSTRP